MENLVLGLAINASYVHSGFNVVRYDLSALTGRFLHLFHPWRWMGHVEGGQRFQPSGHFARHGRAAFDPSYDGRLTSSGPSGKVALGPSEGGDAD